MARKPQRDEAAMRQYIEHISRLLADWGFPRMAGRVLFVLMCADERTLTAAQLAERLDVSPAAISSALKYLIHLNMVVREPVPGSRRDHYRLVDDSWYEVTMAKMSFLRALADATQQGVAAAGGPTTVAGKRLANMRGFYIFVEETMPEIMEKWRANKPQ
jgi:DNA-binding transcriptional regulator GbsR (MarR family)